MKVLVVYYSLYGHVLKMAHAVAEGVGSVDGVEAVLRRVDEFPEVLEEKKDSKHFQDIWNQQKNTPVCTPEDLAEADGVIFGSPTRFGNMTAQMKKLFDSLANLWVKGTMEGKPAGVFSSTATTHGGQETTLFTMMPPLLHLGMIVVGVPYSTAHMLHTEARGGTPYGPTTIAGSGNELQPTAEDLDIARALGRRVAEAAKKLRG